MKTLKIEAGKYYRTRDGRKVRIYAIDAGGNFPAHGAICLADGIWEIRTWMSNGIYSIYGESEFDIISEWKQTIDDIGFDKSCLPKWAKFICMSEIGNWVWSDIRPTCIIKEFLAGYWSVYENFYGAIPTEHAPKNYQGDWKDSLFEIE